ncbi:MAG: hypothetical protein ACFFDF_04600 [Candidatus Odinarchaeota archaeon]
MEPKIIFPVEYLDSSHHNKSVKVQGVITKLSDPFKDDEYGYIQIIFIQNLDSNSPQIGFHRGKYIILQENLIGKVGLGDMIQIKGTTGVYRIYNNKTEERVLLAESLKNIENEDYINITEKEVKIFKNFAKDSQVQQKLANLIFKNNYIEDDIKLIGTLMLFCTKSSELIEQKILCNMSLVILGSSGTLKTTFLNILQKIDPNRNVRFLHKSDNHFIKYMSRSKIGKNNYQEAGLADLSNGGIVIIDNFEVVKYYKVKELDEDFKDILKESSIIAALNCNNVIHNKLNPLFENLQFPRKATLLDKFDLVYFMDCKSENDIQKIVDLNTKNNNLFENTPELSLDLLRKYIRYAKAKYDPNFLEKGVKEEISIFKMKILKLNENKRKKINLNVIDRMIIILSKTYARIALKNEINVNDIQKILRIYKKTLKNLDLI